VASVRPLTIPVAWVVVVPADLEPLLKQLDSFVGQTPAEILEMLEKAGSGRDLYLPPIVKDDFHGVPRPAPATGTAYSASGAGITTTRVITYTYDPLNRLVAADYSTGEQFAYGDDEVSNRTVLTSTTPLSGTAVTTYIYDTANRLTDRAVSDGRTYILRRAQDRPTTGPTGGNCSRNGHKGIPCAPSAMTRPGAWLRPPSLPRPRASHTMAWVRG